MEEKKVDQKNKETSYNYWTKDDPSFKKDEYEPKKIEPSSS